MGIVNVTPDSFSDGGLHLVAEAAIAHAHRLIAEGADLVDVGGESTRPGAEPVPVDVEVGRVVPVVAALSGTGVPISIDTMKPEVMAAALDAGASIVNDVNGFRSPGAPEVVGASGCGVVAVHMLGEPRTMQDAPHYDDVVADVAAFLAERVARLEAAGVDRERIAVDPGIGFGKTLEHNLTLLRRLGEIAPDLPVVLGVSRKGFLGTITGRPVDEREPASIAAALAGVEHGARILRVHDVSGTVDALAVWHRLRP
jgi:dihydropteroate synthase